MLCAQDRMSFEGKFLCLIEKAFNTPKTLSEGDAIFSEQSAACKPGLRRVTDSGRQQKL